MRFRVRVARTEIAERVVSAVDEEGAINKIQAELDKPYGLLGLWKTTAIAIADVEEVPSAIGGLSAVSVPGGPMLLSVKDAADHLGVPRGRLYELVRSGELESVKIGSRRLVSRDALTRFVEANSRTPS